ncbi:MAG: LacI family DNA-binding transcriptional regulator [Bacteroidota bacterium]|nr:LacI family DNA-binding transcriptional regulator [Bacteroidota bacterium]
MNIHEIAKRAGVSIATVSRAFNSNSLIKDDTRRRILQIAEELNYKPSPIARGLSTRQTDTIGVILPDLVGEFFMDIIHGIDEETDKSDKYILVSSSHSKRNIIEILIEFLSSGRVDGVVLMAPQINKEITKLVKKSKRPIVLINAGKDIEDVVNFHIDNYQGACINIEHLIGHGYKNIGMITGPAENWDAQERYAGFSDALEKHNISLQPNLIIEGDFSIKAGFYGFMRLMSQPEKPDAIFCANDMMALGAYEAAKTSNIQIPNDVALTGFDDIFLTRLIQPRLTTVHVPVVELGSKAVRYLLSMINGDVDPNTPYVEALSTGLVIGGSCGCKVNSFHSIL